jgi:glutaredoxin
MKIIMVTQAGCVKCEAAKKHLGPKLAKVEVVSVEEHPEIIKKYELTGSTPIFIFDSGDGFYEIQRSIIFVEKYL